MPIKKSDLYSSLWAGADALRGGMDASQYKDYVLVMLFLKYVSDKAEADPYALIVVPPGCSFRDIAALRGNKDIGEQIDIAIGKIAEANELRNVIDVVSFNDEDKLGKGKEMIDRLSELVAIFESPALNFSKNKAGGDDILGDAYEFLMRHFATESGKAKGQFYTPAEVSRVMAKVLGIRRKANKAQTFYDPHLRLGLAAAQGGRRVRGQRFAVRTGKGCGHRRSGQNEHDPAQQRNRRDQKRTEYALQPAFLR